MEEIQVKKKVSKFKQEFGNFAFKEATLGAAVGIMLGAAFRDVINSLVNDILTPPIAFITSGIDFTGLFWVIGENNFESLEAAREAGVVIVHYGNFINEFIIFLITSFILFLITYQGAKIVSKINKKEKEEVKKEEKKKTKVCKYCMSDIHLKATRCPECTSKL